MKLMVESNSLNETRKLVKLNNVEVIVIGLDFLSFEVKTQNMKAIKKNIDLVHHHKKYIAIDIQRIFHEDDFAFINALLNNIYLKEVDYFIYSDMGIFQLLTNKGLTKKCIYRAPTYLTNTSDVVIFQKLNAYVVASNQITSDELISLSNKAQPNLIIDALGMGCCFYSKRPLLTNYLKFKNLKDNNYKGKILKLKEETRTSNYHFVEDDNGTRIYEENFYALTNELDEMPNVQFLYIHHFNIKCNDYLNLLLLYSDYLDHNISSKTLDEKLKSQKLNFQKGAYNFKTVLLKGDVNNE